MPSGMLRYRVGRSAFDVVMRVVRLPPVHSRARVVSSAPSVEFRVTYRCRLVGLLHCRCRLVELHIYSASSSSKSAQGERGGQWWWQISAVWSTGTSSLGEANLIGVPLTSSVETKLKEEAAYGAGGGLVSSFDPYATHLASLWRRRRWWHPTCTRPSTGVSGLGKLNL
ncbi:hypothetical protein E2562_012084 [Oryza meyeriana var. granulata]|uniref:Uncharacterized protein n=1 Tax=Oryza meyeriana var. granulata TaxID=110450 RepID=A0A6G1F7B4_9ORYZ|nr:hypothetical protein E2562_012084 [Oryza meyeriana var. granulata]